jgi:hypothetical protein
VPGPHPVESRILPDALGGGGPYTTGRVSGD